MPSSGRVVVEGNGERFVPHLQEPREASLPLSGLREIWFPILCTLYPAGDPVGIHYIGHFRGEPADVAEGFVAVGEIRPSWTKTLSRTFFVASTGG